MVVGVRELWRYHCHKATSDLPQLPSYLERVGDKFNFLGRDDQRVIVVDILESKLSYGYTSFTANTCGSWDGCGSIELDDYGRSGC
jgi:hypothetical protein